MNISRSSNPVNSPIPEIFCWTKMGSEAGQALSAILSRKELERRSGDGTFSWGIGNSVGPAIAHAKRMADGGDVHALFTPMKSAAKDIDSSSDELIVWLAYYSQEGAVVALPDHMLVTSRRHSPSGSEKRTHYALICRSDCALTLSSTPRRLDASQARNLVSENPVGASQVTAVVRYQSRGVDTGGAYNVLFQARLAHEGFVRLATAVAIKGGLRALYEELCISTTEAQWRSRISEFKALAKLKVNREPMQTPLFGRL